MTDSPRKYTKELNLLCQWCDVRFTNNKFRMFCTHECKVKCSSALGRHVYSEKEEDLLSSYIGKYPVARIIKAVKGKFEGVSHTGLKLKIEELARKQDVYIRDRVDNLCIAAWAKLLNVNESRIHRWLSKGLLSRRCGNGHMITYGSMRKYASLYPAQFHGMDRDTLKKVFPEARHEKFIELILKTPSPKGIVKQVVCINTRQVYESLGAAERATGVSRKRISKSIDRLVPVLHEGIFLSFRYAE